MTMKIYCIAFDPVDQSSSIGGVDWFYSEEERSKKLAFYFEPPAIANHMTLFSIPVDPGLLLRARFGNNEAHDKITDEVQYFVWTNAYKDLPPIETRGWRL